METKFILFFLFSFLFFYSVQDLYNAHSYSNYLNNNYFILSEKNETAYHNATKSIIKVKDFYDNLLFISGFLDFIVLIFIVKTFKDNIRRESHLLKLFKTENETK